VGAPIWKAWFFRRRPRHKRQAIRRQRILRIARVYAIAGGLREEVKVALLDLRVIIGGKRSEDLLFVVGEGGSS